jgi:multiple sugar transport system ATP-binding protein
MAELKVSGLTKEYSDVVAVHEMDLEVNDGEFVTFVGPSGCGKSTTLQCIAGLTFPTRGTIQIGNEDVTNFPPKDRGIAMVFQNIALFPHMDVYDNISYGLRLRDTPKTEIDTRVERAVETLQLDGMMHRMPNELSGGQRQRVAIGRAIVRDPDVFLMDEPLANLDAKLRTHMRTEIQRIQRDLDVTTVYVTHDQEEAMTMSDRIVIMNDGEIQQVAPPLECYNMPANRFVAGFIGSPSMNFIDGFTSAHQVQTDQFSFDWDLQKGGLSTDTDVTVGIRPEDIYVSTLAERATDPTSAIRARTDVIEPIGSEIYVYLNLEEPDQPSSAGEEQIQMRVPADANIEEKENIEIVLDRARIHLFDRRTGEAIQHGLSPTEIEEDSMSQEADSNA